MAKFKRGEVAEWLSKDGWLECSIVELPRQRGYWYPDGTWVADGSYVIDVPGKRALNGDGTWQTLERRLRKRRPPKTYRDQHTAADKDWSEDLRRYLKQPEVVSHD